MSPATQIARKLATPLGRLGDGFQIVIFRCVLAIRVAYSRRRGPDDSSSGAFEIGKPVPIRPKPTHHLVAAKAFPPSDKPYLYPAD